METSSNSTWNETISILGPREVVGSYTQSAVFFRMLFVLLFRVGLVLIQIGTIPTENVQRIFLQNLVDIGIAITSYGFIGFSLNFGSNSLEGLVGYGSWINSDIKQISLHQAGYGFAAVLIGTGVITTMFCTRLHMLAVGLISFFYSAILYPVVSHWLWVDHGWMQLTKPTIRDYAGGLAVHTTASIIAVVGAVFLRRRMLRLADVSEISVIGVEVSRNTVAGYMFVLIGLIAFILPTPEEEYRVKRQRFDGILFTNSVLALSAAGLVTIILDVPLNCRKKITYWALLKYLQAGIAGIVALSCAIDAFSPLSSFFVGLIAGTLFFFVAAVIQQSFIEDNCNVTASHFVCSLLASFISHLICKSEAKLRAVSGGRFTWQLACYVIIFAVSLVSAVLIFLLLYVSNRLRNRSERLNHRRALTGHSTKMGLSFKNMFGANDERYVEPGASKEDVSVDGEEDVVIGNRIKREAGANAESDTSKEGSVTRIWPSERKSKRSKKYLNLQKSSSQIGRSH